jgi:23S rRNA (guanine745-N1)-methyltransferase
LNLPPSSMAVDLGSGTGRALATIAGAHEIAAVGIDLSIAAATHAARHWPALTWVVANADRTLPLLAGCADVVLSLHARRNPAEVARVLKPSGVFLAAVPAADDLVELRALVQGEGTTRDRVPALAAELAPLLALDATFRVTDRHRFEPELLRALLDATYRGARRSAADRVAALGALDVTVASDVCVLRRSGIDD